LETVADALEKADWEAETEAEVDALELDPEDPQLP
jgi:hypothetical protein